MTFLLKEIVNHCPYDVGVIVADSPESAVKKIGKQIKGIGTGPKGQKYFDLTGEFGKSSYLTMNSMPEINSVEQLKALC